MIIKEKKNNTHTHKYGWKKSWEMKEKKNHNNNYKIIIINMLYNNSMLKICPDTK